MCWSITSCCGCSGACRRSTWLGGRCATRITFRHHADARGLLIVGDSRMRWAMDPRYLAPQFGLPERGGLNMALPGAHVGDDMAAFHWLIKSGYLKDTKIIFWGLGLSRFHADPYAVDNEHVFYQPFARGYNFSGFSDAASRYVTPALCSRVCFVVLWDIFGFPQGRKDLAGQLFHYTPVDYNELGYMANGKEVSPINDFGRRAYADCGVAPELADRLVASAVAIKKTGVRLIVVDPPGSPGSAGIF